MDVLLISYFWLESSQAPVLQLLCTLDAHFCQGHSEMSSFLPRIQSGITTRA